MVSIPQNGTKHNKCYINNDINNNNNNNNNIILLGGRSSNQYNSFSGTMVLKRPFLGDTGEDLTYLFRSWGDRASGHLSHSPGRQSFELIG